MFLLSACGSNSTPPVATDRLAFNAAVVAFDITTDPVTLTAAELAFTNFIAAYPTSSLVDDAYYYIARSVHERAKLAQVAVNPTPSAVTLFTEARSRYSDTTTIPPTSNRADNAQLQIGKTYYDQTTLANNYGLALTQFTFVLTNFPTSSIADDAQYYIGRTKHEQALLAQIVVNPDPIAVTALFTAARDAYTVLLTSPAFSLSTRRDDAQYQIGRTYYDLTIPNYTQAVTEFNKVFDTTLFTAPSVGDDARYYLGRSKHELALLPVVAPAYTLTQARADYSLVIAGYPLSNRRDDAQYQIGRTHFSEGLNFATAQVAFEAVFVAANFPVLSVADDARYYIGRSKHEQASLAEAILPGSGNTLFDAARIEYNQVLTLYCTVGVPPSIRCDDAQFQIGKTYFDETTFLDNYTRAITEFSTVLDPLKFITPSAGDDAQYYIGRAKHAQALLAQIALDTITATSLFTAARDAYNVLLISPTYTLSTRRDDAQYQIGRTYYDLTVPNYSQALIELSKVLDPVLFTSPSAGDDAQYYIGRTKHEMALLPVAVPAFTLQNARAEYSVLLTSPIYALSTRRDDAQYQIGKTYFDDAVPQYVLAIVEFDKVLNLSLYTQPSVGDEAQFYKARSIHELALLGLPALTPYTLADAIAEYAKITATTYPGSNRIDDAVFYSIHAQFPGLL
ncbi:MAG: hypothetical protein ABL858_08870 [Candidatus Nitrotoga sp.]